MEQCIKNKSEYRFVLVEKTDLKFKNMSLWDILIRIYGFERKKFQRPLSLLDLLKKRLNLPYKPKFDYSYEVLELKMNNNLYEVIFDIWNVSLIKNGIIIFDARRFENEELLKLLII